VSARWEEHASDDSQTESANHGHVSYSYYKKRRQQEMNEIEQLKNEFIKQLSPEKIYLFGSFATGTNTEESDLDFYIVVNDTVTDLVEVTSNAYKSIRKIKQRPVDIIVGTQSRFDERKEMMSVENEVYKKGVLIYESGSKTVA
jgi:hypothetical protein